MTASATRPILECRDVGRTYPGGVVALRGVDLTVQRGDLLAVCGPSGSGKTTLLQLMGTLDRPTTGTVRIDGTDTGDLGDRELSRLRARSIGFVFQQFHLSPLIDIVDNVADGLLYAGVRHRERQRRAAEVLERFGLGHRVRHRPQELSGGERQRVAIARAVVGDPSILLADEPTGNLDTANGARVMAALRGLASDGTAVVVITHDREIAADLPTRVQLRDGRVVESAEGG